MTIKKKDQKKIVVLGGILIVLLGVLLMVIQHKQSVRDDIQCSGFSDTGEMIMEIRQNDLPQERVIETLLKDETDEGLIDLVNTTVSEAYEVPLYDSVEDKEKAIADFKETSYNFCKNNT